MILGDYKLSIFLPVVIFSFAILVNICGMDLSEISNLRDKGVV